MDFTIIILLLTEALREYFNSSDFTWLGRHSLGRSVLITEHKYHQGVFKESSGNLQVVFIYLESFSRSLKYLVFFI